MHDNQSRLLLGMALVLAVLVGVLVFVEPPAEDAAPGEAPTAALVPDLQASDVERVRLSTGEQHIELVREGEGWVLRAPFEGPADPTRVEGLVAALSNIEAGDAIELQEAPSAVGLAEGEGVEVTLSTGSGGVHQLVVGADAPVGRGTYILDEAGALRLTRLRLAQSVRPGVDSLRSREVVRFAASAVTGLRFRGAARSVVLDKQDGDWWVEEQGHAVDGVVAEVPAGRHRADGDRVSDALRALQDLRIGIFPDVPLEMAEEALRIEVQAGDAAWGLALGPGVDGAPLLSGPLTGGPVPADLSGLDQVLAVPGTAWRSTLVLPIRPVTVDRIDVRLGDAVLQTRREGLSWQDPRADAVLNALADARVSRVAVAPAPEGEAWGEIALGEGDTAERRVRLHQAVEGGRVAQDTRGGAPFLIGDSAVSALLGALAPVD